ncbi:acyltransferase family protein [Duganella aceris]|uniref:Acyltransferase n=1 Tax=Duganella aceris TaxID=2703883 RepID=A0ABX0FT05_9BURK|nr:acyltransferase [Duganella aceris]NGZ87821.1 acyltransferase [Duganella aceris]
MRERLWDTARGIGIVLVVYGHMLRGLMDGGMVRGMDALVFSDFAIYTFHMPLFFILAGMNAAKGLSRPNFLKSKIPSIVYPYLLWSLIQGTIQLSMQGTTNHSFTLQQLLSILWMPVFQFWFLYAIMLCHVFAWVTTADRLKLGIFALAAYPVGLYMTGPVAIIGVAMNFFIFYTAGVFLGPYLKEIVERMANPRGLLMTAIGLTIAIFVASRVGTYRAPSALSAAFLGSLLVLQLARLLPEGGMLRMVELLGQASMPIYLMHIMGTAGARIFLLKLHITNVGIHLVFGVLCGLLLPLLAFYLSYLTRKEHWFGFGGGEQAFGGFGAARVGKNVS